VSRSSARPRDLLDFADEAGARHDRAGRAVAELVGPLDALARSGGSFVRAPRLRSLAGELRSVLGAAAELDAWVGSVGAAFAAADEGAFGAGGVAVVADVILAGAIDPVPTAVAGAGEAGGPAFVIGPPTRPRFEWDPDFPGDPDDAPTLRDHANWRRWGAMLQAGRHLRPGLDDAVALYRHYRGGTGEPLRVDYEEGYREDRHIRQTVDAQIRSAQQHADELARGRGPGSFSITGDAASAGAIVSAIAGEETYPTETENWRKTLGGYQVWTSAEVEVDGDRATMRVTVNTEDHYNFNDGDADLDTGLPDDDNVRFAQLGWAKGFDVSGSVTRTVTWTLGDPGSEPEVSGSGDPERHPGREDREDGRNSGQSVMEQPQLDRGMGPTRVR
jgi:hypothetical protein